MMVSSLVSRLVPGLRRRHTAALHISGFFLKIFWKAIDFGSLDSREKLSNTGWTSELVSMREKIWEARELRVMNVILLHQQLVALNNEMNN
jgi:hypothetical protein